MTTLTPSERAYLLGSTFLNPDEIEEPEIKPAIVKFRVGPDTLPRLCAAIALMGLESEGAIKLEYVERRKLGLFPSRHMLATPLAETHYPDGSLEAGLRKVLGEKERSVHDLVYRWYGKDRPKPDTFLLTMLRDRLAQAELIQAVEREQQRGGLSGKLLGKTKTVTDFEGRPERLAPEHDGLCQTARDWAEFRVVRASDSDKILTECEKAIADRVESDGD